MDLYYALYGSKVPHCIARPVSTMSMGLPKIPKLSDAKPPSSPHTNGAAEKLGSMERDDNLKRQFESINDHTEIKDEPFEARVDVKVLHTLYSLSYHQSSKPFHSFDYSTELVGTKTGIRGKCGCPTSRIKTCQNGVLF